MDFANAQRHRKSPKNANHKAMFCNLQTCGDFDIGRLVYDEEDGLCKTFLLKGRGVGFVHVY